MQLMITLSLLIVLIGAMSLVLFIFLAWPLLDKAERAGIILGALCLTVGIAGWYSGAF
jgi:4-amino-4-deoxy-L-arabinose transferase-like glycosyltransferase